MPAVNSDEKWEIRGKGVGVARGVIPCTRSLPSSPPRIEQLEKMSLARMFGEYHREEIREDLLMTSSLPSGPLQVFQTVGEPSIEMTNDLLDLTKPLPWDKLKRGASTMSLDSLNENYIDSMPGETAGLEDQDKTPVATCTCGKMTNFECWVHRVPFGGAGELTEEISQTCLQLVQELRSETPGLDSGRFINKPSIKDKLDIPGDANQYMVESPPSNHVRMTIDTPCSWKRESANGDTPSSKSSGSLASAASAPKSELSSSPDSYDLLYKSFEVAVEMDRLQMERGQSEGSSVGSSLESLNRTSPKLQKVLSQKRRSSPDGSVETPRDSLSSVTGSQNNKQNSPDLTLHPSTSATDTCHYEIKLQKDSYASEGAAQKVTFASLAKKKKKAEVQIAQVCHRPAEVTHWTELVSGLAKEETEPLYDTIPEEAPISIPEVGNKAKRPHSLPIQLRHIQKPSSRPQQTPEQSQGSAGSMTLGFKGVTRTISAPEGFSCSLPRSAGSGQDFSVPKTASWVLPSFSQSTSCLSLLTRKCQLNSQQSRLTSPTDKDWIYSSQLPIGSPLITKEIQDNGHGMGDCPYRNGRDAAKGPVQAGRPRVLAMDINANFTEPQEPDVFIPEHHHFIPQEPNSETDASPTLRKCHTGSFLQDRLHLRSEVGVESSSDWVPGSRCTWLDVSRRTMQPPRTLDLLNHESWQQQQEKLQTCSRGCSTDSPPSMDMQSFLKTYLEKEVEVNLRTEEPPREYKDVGVSTDAALTDDHLCPCAMTCCRLAEPGHKLQQEEAGTQTGCSSDHEEKLKIQTKSVIVPDASSKKVSTSTCHQQKEHKGELKVPKISQKRPPGKKSVKGKDTKLVDKTASQAKRRKDNTEDKPREKRVQSWRLGDRGRRDSQTTVTCEESRFKDALTNRVVRIENVGASTLPTSSDKRYIPHRPLKPICQVDAEHHRRKAVLQKLYGNESQSTTPLPPTVTAWPSLLDSMHSRTEQFHSLPTNLSRYDGTSLNQTSQSQCSSNQTGSTDRPIKRMLSWESGAARYGPHDDDPQNKGLRQRPLSLDVSNHNDASADCLPPQEMQVSPRESEEEVNLVQKKALVTSVECAVEHILSHFAQARTKSLEEKGRLGSSAHSPDIGHLMLHFLCPAIRALLMDGMRPYMASFFVGRMKTTLWDVVEATTQLGPGTRPLHELIRHLVQLMYLKTSDLRVNAFIMGLLNIRCLELWLEHIRDHPDVVRSLYEPNAFLSLCNGATKDLFDHLLIAVQPLTLLPFDLEFNFEHQGLVHKRHQQRERQQLMERYSGNASNSLLLAKSQAPVGGSWFRETASLFWKSRGPEQPSATRSATLTSDFLKNVNGKTSDGRTKNSQSSERPVRGLLKTDENATPEQGVESTRDLANKEAANSWSLNWIKGFAKASETSKTRGGMSGTRPVMSSGSAWSRFGSSLSKAFDRIRSEGPTQPHPPRQTIPKTQGKTDSASSMQPTLSKTESSSSPVSPGSPVKARCHHVTMSQEELSFAKGSILTVQQQVDPDWLMCKQGDQSGLVHIDYVQGME